LADVRQEDDRNLPSNLREISRDGQLEDGSTLDRKELLKEKGVFKIATVVGARPQFIKAATISRSIAKYSSFASYTLQLEEILIHTGQHYHGNMSKVFFDELGIPRPNYNLGIGSAPHGAQTGQMLASIEEVLVAERPDSVLVYGDTNSTLAGCLAAAKLRIPVAHVEAGLRSFNRNMPEEINRVLTDHASDLLFAPTQAAVANLKKEGIPEQRIYMVGDVMYDAALYYGSKANRESQILKRLGLEPKSYILATVHRPENADDPNRLKTIFEGLAQVSVDIPVVLPLHPRTRVSLDRWKFIDSDAKRLILIEPVGYLDMLSLEKNALLIATDSGGVQKEAFFQKVSCVTLRTETEWVELVDMGWNRLVTPDNPERIALSIRDALVTGPSSWTPLYGDGRSAEKVLAVLLKTCKSVTF